MIIFVSGVHGCGKTTLINDLRVDMPVTKVLNLDLNPRLLHNKPCAANQFIRHIDYFDNMHVELKKQPEHLIVVDRAPISLNIYDKSFKDLGIITAEAYADLHNDWVNRLNRFRKALDNKHHKTMTFFMDVPLEQVKQNILSRSRDDKLNEGDWSYLEMVDKTFRQRAEEVDNLKTLPWNPDLSVSDNYQNMIEEIKKQVIL